MGNGETHTGVEKDFGVIAIYRRFMYWAKCKQVLTLTILAELLTQQNSKKQTNHQRLMPFTPKPETDINSCVN